MITLAVMIAIVALAGCTATIDYGAPDNTCLFGDCILYHAVTTAEKGEPEREDCVEIEVDEGLSIFEFTMTYPDEIITLARWSDGAACAMDTEEGP